MTVNQLLKNRNVSKLFHTYHDFNRILSDMTITSEKSSSYDGLMHDLKRHLLDYRTMRAGPAFLLNCHGLLHVYELQDVGSTTTPVVNFDLYAVLPLRRLVYFVFFVPPEVEPRLFIN